MKIFVIGDYSTPSIINRFISDINEIPGMEVVEPSAEPSPIDGHMAEIDKCQAVFILNGFSANSTARIDFMTAVSTQKDLYSEWAKGMEELSIYTEMGII